MMSTLINPLKNPFRKSKRSVKKSQGAKLEDSIFQQLQNEKTRLRNISEQLSPYVSDVFRSLGNHDVRFDFDPFSLDDCRCELVSSREINVLCTLKHVPLQSLVIEEDSLPGLVKLRLRDGFVESYDGPSWENDIFVESSTASYYLDATRILQCFSTSIADAVRNVNEDMPNGAACVSLLRDSNGANSLFVQLSENDAYKVNLFPSIRVNECCENFECLREIISEIPNPILAGCCVDEAGIHLVAKHAAGLESSPSEGEYWRVTFNDIEQRILLLDTFEYGNDCFLLLNMLNNLRVDEEKAVGIHPYKLKMIVLREMFERPNARKWNRKNLPKRIMRLLASLEGCLRNGKCLHVFTNVNLFSNMDPTTLKEMSVRVKELRRMMSPKNALIKGI